MAARVVQAVGVVGVMSGRRAVERRCGEGLTLDLVGSLCQDGDVHVGLALHLAAKGATVSRVSGQDVLREGMRRRDVGRGQARSRRRPDRLGCRRRSHHAILGQMGLRARVVLVLTSPRVGVAVYS